MRLADKKVYTKLSALILKAGSLEHEGKDWIRVRTWSLVYKQVHLRQNGKLGNGLSWRFERKIMVSLKGERIKQARKVGNKVLVHLGTGEMKEARMCV